MDLPMMELSYMFVLIVLEFQLKNKLEGVAKW